MPNFDKIPREGDLYQYIELYGHCFSLCYGYYEEADRENGEPVVLYPNLKANPLYAPDGSPLVTVVQMPCDRYQPMDPEQPEECCGDCLLYEDHRQEIARCMDPQKRKPNP